VAPTCIISSVLSGGGNYLCDAKPDKRLDHQVGSQVMGGGQGSTNTNPGHATTQATGLRDEIDYSCTESWLAFIGGTITDLG